MASTPRAAALLVGIDDYAAYDASRGFAPGTSSLKGGLDDVKAWYVVARSMGIPADAIEVRTTPVMSAADMPVGVDATGTRFGPATHDGILEGVRNLGSALGGDGLAQGLLTYSGHGATGGVGAVLCPSDLTGETLENSISYPALVAALDEAVPAHSLTIVLDTCHSAPKRRPGTFAVGARSLGRPVGSGPVPVPKLRSHDRVLYACGPFETAESYHFQGKWHGAFTWSLTTILERWSVHENEGVKYFGVAYADLLKRASELLATAGFAQRPQGSFGGDGAVPFGYPGGPVGAPVESGPVQGPGQEIDPGDALGFADTVYNITSIDGTTNFGTLVVVGPNNVTINNVNWGANQEYWFWSGNPFPQVGWILTNAGQTPPAGLAPQNAVAYPSIGFPDDTSNWTVTNGLWFKISRGSSGNYTFVGWLKVKSDSGGLTENHWYECPPSGQSAPQWFTLTTGAPNLKFHSAVSAPPNNTIPNASQVIAEKL